MISRRLEQRIKQAEGYRDKVYDDATGETIGPDSHVKGIPTIAWGRNLLHRGVSEEEAQFLFDNDTKLIVSELLRNPWFIKLDYGPRREAIIEMAYNMGTTRLRSFKKMIAALDKSDFKTAAHELQDSLYYRRHTRRAERLRQQVLNNTEAGSA